MFIYLSSYPQSREWSIVASYSVPGKASGLAWDGTYIYFGIYGLNGDHFYQFDPSTGSSSLLFTNPAIDDSFGMTWDGSNLWIIDQPSSSSQPALATELDLSGNILSTITLSDHYMSGIAYDNDDFWVGTYYPNPGVIYKINSSGGILSQFVPPADQPWDICKHGSNLWIADYYAHTLYKVTQSGTVLEQHPCENERPSGVVYDGTFLWYVDGPTGSNSTLYKVDLDGAGTPVINIPVDEHDYGIVTIGQSETWNMQVKNTGTASLTITNIMIPGSDPVSTTFMTPQTIQPGGSLFVPLKYQPTAPVPLNTTVIVYSSDPIHPQEYVHLTGHGVNPGPSISIDETSHSYGLVRKVAFTRWFLEIQNLGDQDLVISGIDSSEPVFIVDQDQEFPISLSPLEISEVGIWFNPTTGDVFNGSLEVNNNDPSANPEVVLLEGEGNEKRWLMGEVLWHYTVDESYDNSPKAMQAIQDITGDEVDDMVICTEDNFIRCFNGNSSGIADVLWATEIYSGNVAYQNDITTIPDIDSDGYEDVIVGTTGADESVVAISGKTGTVIWKFETSDFTGVGGWLFQVHVKYDYNSDDFPDVIAASSDGAEGDGPARIICLDGISGDLIWDYYTGGPNFSAIGVSDFTGDDFPDAIGGSSSSDETQGYVYGINGLDGTLEWTYQVDGSSVWALEQLNDINGNGTEDIIAGDFDSKYYYLEGENGAELFSDNLGFFNIILRFARLDDVNGDGHPDFVPGYRGDVGTMLNGYDGSDIWTYSLADKSWCVDRIGDVTGDGVNDVIIGTLYTNNYCYFLDGVTGEELEKIFYDEPVDAIRSIPDIVGDGSMEMVTGGRWGKVTCYSGGINTGVGVPDKPAENGPVNLSIYPNPVSGANHQLEIRFTLTEPTHVEISIVSGMGRKIEVIGSGTRGIGSHQVSWRIPDLPKGLYLIRLQTGNGVETRKLIIL